MMTHSVSTMIARIWNYKHHIFSKCSKSPVDYFEIGIETIQK